MISSIEQSPLYPIANPRHIAIFGASNQASSMGTGHLHSLRELGFPGTIYPVHPREKEVQGLKAYASVLDLPEVPDLALLVLPTRIVPGIIDECGRKGIRHAIVVSGGFKEVGGEGVRLEEELRASARKHGIRFLGPNCIGVANPHRRLNTTFFDFDGKPGFIGMASQSGSFVTQMFSYLARHDMGFSTGFSVGNEADIDILDAMEYLGACPHTRVIALYIEGIRRGRAFLELARSIVPEKPIVALYVGGSGSGKRASLSHTGAMAGPDGIYEGAFHQGGILRASSITEMFDFCRVLGALPSPGGDRVAVQTHSGGPGAVAADACGRAGLRLPPLSPSTLEKLASLVPVTGSVDNPVDMTYFREPGHYFREVPRALLEDPGIDALLLYLLLPEHLLVQALEGRGVPKEKIPEQSRLFIREQAASLRDLVREYGKPLAGYTFRALEEPLIKELRDRGIPVFPDSHRAAGALRAMVLYARARERILADGPTARDPG
ncbi:MAG: CoA-binding protein [Deltaproteobacteria bacterium]|nr:CoA-binding protein [Deltaproteobacteria bacterium]